MAAANNQPLLATRLVQFIHPGHEYPASRIGLQPHMTESVMGWKFGDRPHDRKFLQTMGTAYDAKTHMWHDHQVLRFWGEWEPPSRVWRLNRNYQNWGLPALVHEPIWPTNPPPKTESSPDGIGYQNTDPMVFGDRFVYSNCRQRSRALRSLAVGSIVLFGRGSTNLETFQLDTCLVVEERLTMREVAHPSAYGQDLLQDVVIDALGTENVGAQESYLDSYVVYFGATPTREGLARPFSFFPAKVKVHDEDAFSKATISLTEPLKDLFNPRLQQGFKATVIDESALASAWREVVRQVTEQGYLLGTNAEPLREHVDAPQVK